VRTCQNMYRPLRLGPRTPGFSPVTRGFDSPRGYFNSRAIIAGFLCAAAYTKLSPTWQATAKSRKPSKTKATCKSAQGLSLSHLNLRDLQSIRNRKSAAKLTKQSISLYAPQKKTLIRCRKTLALGPNATSWALQPSQASKLLARVLPVLQQRGG